MIKSKPIIEKKEIKYNDLSKYYEYLGMKFMEEKWRERNENIV